MREHFVASKLLFVMKKFILFILLAVPVFGWGQNLRGKISDTNGNPLAGANLQHNGKGTISDQDGQFMLPCSAGADLVISFVGYETVKQSISDCSIELNISLNPSTQVLNKVEITATSIQRKSLLNQPTSIAKIGTVEITRGTGLFLDDAINANIPGVFMQRRTNSAGQQFNIRGYGGGGPGNRGVNNNFDQLGIKAYLNGIPITDAEGITLMDDIDFNSIGTVEVVKGPSGTLYGLAIAGVVNLQTIKPEKEEVSIGQNIMLGSYGLQRFTTTLQSNQKGSSILVNYGKQNFDGFMVNTAARKDFVNFMGEFVLNQKQSLTAYMGWSDSYDQRNGELTSDQYNNFDYSGNPAYIKNDAHTNVTSLRAGLSHTYKMNDHFSNTTALFGTGLNSNVSSAGGWTDKAPVNFGLRSVFETTFNLGKLKISGLTGVEAQRQIAQLVAYPMVVNNADPSGKNILGAIRTNQTQISSTYSLFTQWTIQLPMEFSLTAGIGTSSMHIDLLDKLYVAANNTSTNKIPSRYTTDYTNLVSPSFALNKLFNKKISAHISYSQGYRAPVASNIYVPLGGFVNTGLRPEVGKQFEIGTKGILLQDRLTYEVAWFSSVFSEKMTLLGVPNTAGTATLYSYVVNAGGLNNTGIEALVKYNAYQSTTGFVKLVRPFINLTHSDFKYDGLTFNNNIATPVSDFSGNQVAGVPKVVYNAGIDFLSNTGLYANAIYMHRDDMPYTPDGLNTAKGFNLLNAKIGFQKRFATHFDVDVFFGAQNITSQQHYQMVFVNQLPDAYLPGPKDINYFGGINFKYLF